jgi:hypothetical protein
VHGEQLGYTMSALEDLLHQAQNDLLQIRRRHFALQKVTRELERVSRGKRFNAWNDVVWWMLADHHQVLVTELASWARSHCQPGGLFGQLQAHHLAAFPGKRTWGKQGEAADLTRLFDKNHAAARQRIFPAASTTVKPSDVSALKDRFHGDFKPLIEDRHVRAHPYETTGSVSAKMLDAEAVGRLIEQAAQMLNDLTVVAYGSTHNPSEVNYVNTDANAEDLADQVLIGTSARRRVLMGALERDGYYAALHRLHDAASGIECFNDHRIEGALRREQGDT